MGDHPVLCVNCVEPIPALENSIETGSSSQRLQDSGSQDCSLALHTVGPSLDDPSEETTGRDASKVIEDEEKGNTVRGFEGDPLTGSAECRICQEEDDIVNLESPCSCSGTLKYAHRKCVQRWCNEKGDIVCEICHQLYKSGYVAPPPIPIHSDDFPIDIGAQQLDLQDPRIYAMAAEQQYLEAQYGDYEAASASSAACCRSAALILIALLLLRHALTMTAVDTDEDMSTFLTLFLLRAAGFILPCYIMARAMSMLQRRRQAHEAAMAASEVAVLLQARRAQDLTPDLLA
eukprot:c19482_g1_i1 orf=501-1370(+)